MGKLLGNVLCCCTSVYMCVTVGLEVEMGNWKLYP